VSDARVAASSSAVRRAARAWTDFWFAPLDPHAVAAFRIALGAVGAALLVAQGPDWERFYGPSGILPLDEPVLQTYPRHHLSLFTVLDGVVPVAAFWWVGVGMALALAAGLAGRLAAAALFILLTSQVLRVPPALSGEDWVLRLALLPAAFATLDARWSVRAWWRRRRRRPALAPGPVWPVRLVQIHTVLIYVFTMANRLASEPAWWTGEAMYWVLVNATWGAWPWPGVVYRPGVARAATWAVLALEGLFPLAVCWRPTRRAAALGLIVLHVGAAVALRGVLFFSLSMVCPLLLFLSGDGRARAARSAVPALRAGRNVDPTGIRDAGSGSVTPAA
jgi:hypothetical protein